MSKRYVEEREERNVVTQVDIWQASLIFGFCLWVIGAAFFIAFNAKTVQDVVFGVFRVYMIGGFIVAFNCLFDVIFKK